MLLGDLETPFLPGLDLPVQKPVAREIPRSMADLRRLNMADPEKPEDRQGQVDSLLTSFGTILANEDARRKGRATHLDQSEIDFAAIPCGVRYVNALLPAYSRAW